MIFNYVIGLGIPWIFIIMLYKNDKKLVLFIMPFASVVSHTINGFGFYLKLWSIVPVEIHTFSALPYDLGLFALLGIIPIYIIQRLKKNPYIVVMGFAFGTTVLEYIFLLLDKIVYFNWWNIFFTYLSYLIAYALVYLYYMRIKNHVKGWTK